MNDRLESMKSVFNDFEIIKGRIANLPDEGCSRIIVSTDNPKRVIKSIFDKFESINRQGSQLYILSEPDKQELLWLDKASHAANNGNWLILSLDSFWIDRLQTIVSETMGSIDCRLWIICPPHFINEIPKRICRISLIVTEINPYKLGYVIC